MSLSPSSQAMLDRYRAVKGALAGHDLPWLASLRDRAADDFGAAGFPTQRVEEWKYTSLKALDGIDLAAEAAEAEAPALPDPLTEGPRLVFVDGRYRADLSHGSTAKGVRLSNLAADVTEHAGLIQPRLADNGEGAPLLAVNGAFAEDGYVIELADDAEGAVEILHWATGRAPAIQPRNVIAAGAGSRLTLAETHGGEPGAKAFFNGATLVTAGPGATVAHLRIQDQPLETVHVNTVRARIERDARYLSFVQAEGGSVARDDLQIMLAGEGASATLRGVYLGRGKQVIDNTLAVRHAAPATTSSELYKGVLDGAARGVFQGGILVDPGADGADGQMTNRSLLLSDEAEADTKPQLEIYADDVKCSHGATVGELDAEALFYLRSRGIPEAQARGILIEAFLDEVIGEMSHDEIADSLRVRVAAWLGRKAMAEAA